MGFGHFYKLKYNIQFSKINPMITIEFGDFHHSSLKMCSNYVIYQVKKNCITDLFEEVMYHNSCGKIIFSL